ncbi:MAG TPA: twin-arginine translocase subunit TatC [Bacillota bacterium]|nr:twin-arginine translocase subunit TatC [Bacillota bacterium]
MNFWQHLAELRRRLIRIATALFLGFVFSLWMSKELLTLLTANAGQLVFLRPAEALISQLKVALINGIVVSLPVTLWQIGAFLWPGLYRHERRAVMLFIPFAFVLFCIGLGFGYWVVVRLGYRYLLSYATDQIVPMISLATYLSFVLTSMLLCAVVFLLPVVIVFLALLGVVQAGFLWRQQRKLIIGLVVLVALITPTVDIFSLLLILVPILILVEISIFMAWLVERGKAKRLLQTEIPD